MFGCQSDIVLPPETPLAGSYSGTYSYITDYKNPAAEQVITAEVLFTFAETSFHMNLDTAAIEQQHCFCAVDGDYALTEGVRLKKYDGQKGSQPDGKAGCQSCNSEEDPEGVFVRETKGDSLILKLQEGTTLKMLRLLKYAE